MVRRELPDWAQRINLQGQLPQWFAYDCPNDGTVMLLQPFVNIRQVPKG